MQQELTIRTVDSLKELDQVEGGGWRQCAGAIGLGMLTGVGAGSKLGWIGAAVGGVVGGIFGGLVGC
jgi:Bacteriocin class II with double-glycine leader peptide